jgi:hypothetical protein
MTTVDRVEQEMDAGHVAVLGHRLLGSAAVVTGALTTLRAGNGSVSAPQRALLEAEVVRNLATITEIAHTLIHPNVNGERPPDLCSQCYGRGRVRIAGRTVLCTCAW